MILAVLVLTTLAPAQGHSGRHFLRESRMPATAAASPVVDAAASTRRVEPLRRLRSGRSWSLFHFGRRPVTPATTTSPVDASAAHEVRRTLWWGRRLRHGAR